jgi:hypothetical protein
MAENVYFDFKKFKGLLELKAKKENKKIGAIKNELMELCGTSRQSVFNWIKGLQVPELTHLIIIQKFLSNVMGKKDNLFKGV